MGWDWLEILMICDNAMLASQPSCHLIKYLFCIYSVTEATQSNVSSDCAIGLCFAVIIAMVLIVASCANMSKKSHTNSRTHTTSIICKWFRRALVVVRATTIKYIRVCFSLWKSRSSGYIFCSCFGFKYFNIKRMRCEQTNRARHAHAEGKERERHCQQFQSIASCVRVYHFVCCAVLRIQAINWYLNSSSVCVRACEYIRVENLLTIC